MNFKITFQFLLLLMITSLFFQCSKDDQLNQVGTWDATYTFRGFSNDSMTSENTGRVEMILKSDETGTVKGNINEATLEWDLIFSDTKINLIENYFLFDQNVIPHEPSLILTYEMLRNEKNNQEWYYEDEFTLQDSTTMKISRNWKLDRK